MRTVLLICVALAGCQRHKTSSCESAVAGAMDRMVAEQRPKMPPTVAANIARVLPLMKQSITEACETDHWSAQAIECVSNAKGRAALGVCDQMLTPEQRTHEHSRDDELLRAAVQPLQKPDAEKVYRDPHSGLGIAPVSPTLQGKVPLNGSAGSATSM